MKTINIADKFDCFDDHWHPRIIAGLNGQHVKVARLKGNLVWHSHSEEDEMFMVIRGTLYMKFRDHEEVVKPGEMIVVPRGVEHYPYTKDEQEVLVVLFEPESTKHTGDVIDPRTVNKQEWI
jgi:mannose-6-phosphate isomerase-like protein (cupin superfamily)